MINTFRKFTFLWFLFHVVPLLPLKLQVSKSPKTFIWKAPLASFSMASMAAFLSKARKEF